MSYGSIMNMPPPSREMSRKAAIVGLGETDYHLDYLAERAKAPGYESPTVEGLCTKAFERALSDLVSASQQPGPRLRAIQGGA